MFFPSREKDGTSSQSDFRYNSYWLLNTTTLKPKSKRTREQTSESSYMGNCRTFHENIIVKNHPLDILSPLHNKQHSSVNQIRFGVPPQNQPEAFMASSTHTFIQSYLMHHIRSSYKTVPHTFDIVYRELTSQLHQAGFNRALQALTKMVLRSPEARKNLPKIR